MAAALLWLTGCSFAGDFGVEQRLEDPASRPKKPRPEGARLEDPLYYFHNDRLGTPVRLTDEAGRTVWRAEYRPFGDLQSLQADPDRDRVAVENNLRLPGQYDEALGSLMFQQGPYYNWNRWYFPGEGRYGSSEPLLQSQAYVLATLSFGGRVEPYVYAQSSPFAFTDRTGLFINPWSRIFPLPSPSPGLRHPLEYDPSVLRRPFGACETDCYERARQQNVSCYTHTRDNSFCYRAWQQDKELCRADCKPDPMPPPPLPQPKDSGVCR